MRSPGAATSTPVTSPLPCPTSSCYRHASQRKTAVLSRITWRFDETTTGSYDFCVLPLDDDGHVARRGLAVECYAQLEKQYRL